MGFEGFRPHRIEKEPGESSEEERLGINEDSEAELAEAARILAERTAELPGIGEQESEIVEHIPEGNLSEKEVEELRSVLKDINNRA